jgi:hypothetical protein
MAIYMGKKFFLLKLSMVLAALLLANLFLRKAEPFSYTVLLNYNQLYFDRDRIHMEDFGLSGDSLQIRFSGNLHHEDKNSFQVYEGPSLLYQIETTGTEIRFRLDHPGLHHISIAVNGSADRIPVNIDFSPDSIFTKNGNSHNVAYELTSNVPAGKGPFYASKDWAVRFPGYDKTPAGVQTAQILKDSIQILSLDDSKQRVLKIARFILRRTQGKEGIPTDELSALNPLEQLQSIEAGKSKAWCGNFSAIFSWFATASGLQVRIVSCGFPERGVSTGNHEFCEVYLKEEQVWAYVDLTSKNILTKCDGKWLNAIDIDRLLSYRLRDSNFLALHFEEDSIIEIPFDKVSSLAAYYFHTNAIFSFYFGGYLEIQHPGNIFLRAIKFFYPKPYYAVYSDNLPIGNDAFFLRILTNYLLAAGCIIWLIAVLKRVL